MATSKQKELNLVTCGLSFQIYLLELLFLRVQWKLKLFQLSSEDLSLKYQIENLRFSLPRMIAGLAKKLILCLKVLINLKMFEATSDFEKL